MYQRSTLTIFACALVLTSGLSQAKQQRIIGGTEAAEGNYPWMTALIDSSESEQFCGGSLIAKNWVLTAAHCVEDTTADGVNVFIGGLNVTDLSAGEVIEIESIHIHPEYEDDHDIALLRLKRSSGIAPVSRAGRALDDNLAEGTNLTVMGWGLTSAAETANGSNTLLEVDVPLRNRAQCISAYEQSDQIEITDNMICAGGEVEEKDSCNGDSGGPMLVRDSAGNWQQLGVVSFGSSRGCAAKTHPGVYTRVSRYIDWMGGVMNGSGLGVSAPKQVEFGYVPTGLPATETITISNESAEETSIQGVNLSGDSEFTVESDNCSQAVLAADAQCEIVVSFNAQAADQKEAQLSIASTSGVGTNLTVNLSAFGLPEIDIGDALDNADLQWWSGVDAEWLLTDSDGAVAGTAAQSGSISDDQITVLLTELSGPGPVSFRWKTSTEEEYDQVSFSVDGNIVTTLSGEQEWQDFSYDLPAGSHRLSWEYVKDSIERAGQDIVQLDAVRFGEDVAGDNSGTSSGAESNTPAASSPSSPTTPSGPSVPSTPAAPSNSTPPATTTNSTGVNSVAPAESGSGGGGSNGPLTIMALLLTALFRGQSRVQCSLTSCKTRA